MENYSEKNNRFKRKTNYEQKYWFPNKRRYFYNKRNEDRYNYPTRQDRSRDYRDKYGNNKFKRKPSRPSSPVEGSEEYMTQKIQKTSAIIMRHLLSPEENIIPVTNPPSETNNKSPESSKKMDTINKKKQSKWAVATDSSNKKPSTYNVEEIHNKIMNHLSNLNDGRKKNFISTNSSVFDGAINQMIKQRRLEISRALRDVCLQTPDVNESTEWINSIIPEIGIKIEDLPQEVLEALQFTFSNPEEEVIMPIVDSTTVTSPLPESSLPTEESAVKIKEEYPDKQVEIVEILPEDILDSWSSQRNENLITESDSGENETLNVGLDVDKVQTVSDEIVVENNEEKSAKCLQKNTKLTIEDFLRINFQRQPKSFSAAVKRMEKIDGYISKLTEYRQNLFKGLKIKKRVKHTSKSKGKSGAGTSKRILQSEKNEVEQKVLDFQDVTEKILVLKICENKLAAGTEGGKVYIFDLESASCLQILDVTTVPIVCLHYSKQEQGKPLLFVGSFESSLKIFNFYSSYLVQDVQFDDSVQCVDENWSYLFMGCLRGTILRYSMKKKMLEYEERFDSHPIFVLKATQEGARMVLLIGSRNSAVIIRDAMSGLHLRTLEKIITPTIYSMTMERHLVYCGTTTHDILVYDFHNGKLVHTYKASNAKGISCVKLVGKCLFASCHNGKIYIYNLETNKHVGTLDGPGGVIISMEVFKNQVIVGTMSCKFSSILIPLHILRLV